ncbi:MAG: MMPL family transporter [Dehalococcoidia bacterium]
MPIIPRAEDFDYTTGSLLERIIFNNRILLIILCVIITSFLGFHAAQLEINASFEKMMPVSQPYIKNYMANKDSLRGLGNSVRIVVENTKGDIYDPSYLAILRDINDKVFLIPGVDRSFMKSLWMPVVRWTEITEEGYVGGPVMPDTYDGSAGSLKELHYNVTRSGLIGSLVANDQRSSMIFVPLLDHYAATGKPLNYKAFRDELNKIRDYENKGVRIHIIGFAQLVGDLIHGLFKVFTYFFYAAGVVILLIYLYTRCIRSTLLVVGCSLIAVVWQLGIMRLCGFVLDPYSMLVPFLVFAIGVSHGSQKMNGIMQDVGRGTHRYVAARYTFRRLFLAGLTAILTDAIGFLVLVVIDIPVIQGLAIASTIGVTIVIFTNLILLPVLLSFTGVNKVAGVRSLGSLGGTHPLVRVLGRFTRRRWWATGLIAVAVVITAVGFVISGQLKIGDLDPGAPELRPESQYNLDNAYITKNYGLSSDQFAVIVTTPHYGLVNFETLLEMDRLEDELRDVPGVQTTVSAASLARLYTAGGFEGAMKWVTINRDTYVVGDATNYVFDSNPELFNEARSIGPVIAFLADHKAETLTRVVKTVEKFAKEHDTKDRKFLLAAGTSGIEAATNIAVKQANVTMLLYIYGATIILCFLTFRSWRAVIVAVVPLIVTSILCEALMVKLGIGVKVATLPVTALGVGIGVDYSLYLLSIYMVGYRMNRSVGECYSGAVMFTGKVVGLIGITMATAVITWAWSPIKFQADMGILLAFMFLWNMVGVLTLAPALAAFLLRPKSKQADR